MLYQFDCFQCSGELSLTKSASRPRNSAAFNKINWMIKKHTCASDPSWARRERHKISRSNVKMLYFQTISLIVSTHLFTCCPPGQFVNSYTKQSQNFLKCADNARAPIRSKILYAIGLIRSVSNNIFQTMHRNNGCIPGTEKCAITSFSLSIDAQLRNSSSTAFFNCCLFSFGILCLT